MTTGYLDFRVDEQPSERRKTAIVGVYATSSGMRLGQIKWWGRWRCFCFFPDASTLYNPDCLREIADKCAGLTATQRERANAARPARESDYRQRRMRG